LIIISTPHVVLKTKHFLLNHGQPYYQRAIPKHLVKYFNGQKKISRKLIGSETSMTLEIAKMAARDTQTFLSLSGGAGEQAELEAKALALLGRYGLKPLDGLSKVQTPYGFDTPHLTDIEEYFEYRGSRNELSDADLLAQRLLREPLPLTLSRVMEIYFANHPKGTNERFQRNATMHWCHVERILGDIPLAEITRDMARNFVKARLEEGVKTASVRRELNTIQAALKVVIREKSLKLENHFEGLAIPGQGRDSKKREPFSHDEHSALIKRCLQSSDDVRVLTLLCAITGARISEIAGLRVSDVDLSAEVPHISIADYGNRTLKTPNSRRLVPLVHQGAEAVSSYLKTVTGVYLFPRYANDQGVNSNAASATVNKFIRTLAPEKTSHCLRHTMMDLCRAANVPDSVALEIGGWSGQSIGHSYGHGYSMIQKREALTRALSPVLDSLPF
jgi:integrase